MSDDALAKARQYLADRQGAADGEPVYLEDEDEMIAALAAQVEQLRGVEIVARVIYDGGWLKNDALNDSLGDALAAATGAAE